MKKRLKLPDEMQMYSLRDSGIYDMLKSGIDDLSVMQHADHSSLEMTTLYGNHFDKDLIKKIIDKAPKF
jgi:integrase